MAASVSLPADFHVPLLLWFDGEARVLPWRESRDPYRIWVSEIMLQQTRVEAVKPYYERFLQACPTVQALACADEQLCLKLWEGLGYYSRVRNLHRAAQQVMEQYDGRLPADYEKLLTLPGIGEYTAGAIASIAFGIPVPAVDGNVLRVIARLTADKRSVTEPAVKRAMRQAVQQVLPEERAGDFNQALMELGALVCVPNGAPHCVECPVQPQCVGYGMGLAQSLPQKAPKKQRRIENRTVFLLRFGDTVALRRRPERGLLAGMWEFPAAERCLSPEEAEAFLQEQDLFGAQLLSLRPAKHIFTHVEWHMTGYYLAVSTPPAQSDLVWATMEELRTEYALPSAFRAFRRVLEAESQ